MASADEGTARQEARRFVDNKAAEAQSVTVTGARVRRPNLESASPVTSVESAEARDDLPSITARRLTEPRFRRGDWNACTVDDPTRSLRGCAGLVDPRARGEPGRAGAGIADGLALAWRGDFNGAIRVFDGVIAATPRSSFAYLNRGQVKRRIGDLDGALADLDRAVRYAPRTARAYYNRSLVLRQKGDLRQARADEVRAVDLDERYAPLVQ
jgi:tetratricopeptide (TPR) repeat protein